MNDIKDRIALLVEYKGLNSSRFADIIDIQRSRMSHVMSGRNNPSIDVIAKIVEKFPDISMSWLVTGMGDMLVLPNELSCSSSNIKEEDEPVYNSSKTSDNKTSVDNSSSFNKSLSSFIPSANTKQIDRIIVFYKDDSFKEYRPE